MSEYIYQSQGEPLMNERGELYLARAGEIVRCRDCKWYIQANSMTGWNDICNMTNSKVQSDGFCAWPEPKEGGESC